MKKIFLLIFVLNLFCMFQTSNATEFVTIKNSGTVVYSDAAGQNVIYKLNENQTVEKLSSSNGLSNIKINLNGKEVLGYVKNSDILGNSGLFEVHTLKLGDASGFVIRTDNHAIVIDGGYLKHGKYDVQYISDLGITKIDAYICSHFDPDHVWAGGDIVNAYKPDYIYVPKKIPLNGNAELVKPLREAMKKQGLTFTVLKPNDTVDFEDFSLYVLGPEKTKYGTLCSNYDSLNFMITFGDTKFFFSGDYAPWKYLTTTFSEDVLKCDFVQIAHHGLHNYIFSANLINVMKPKVAVVNSGGNHMDGNRKKVLSELGCQLYQTYQYGNIVTVSDGKELKVYTKASASNFKR